MSTTIYPGTAATAAAAAAAAADDDDDDGDDGGGGDTGFDKTLTGGAENDGHENAGHVLRV